MKNNALQQTLTQLDAETEGKNTDISPTEKTEGFRELTDDEGNELAGGRSDIIISCDIGCLPTSSV